MFPLAVCLSLASFATAQVVSMVPIPVATTDPGSVASSDSSSSSSSYPSPSYSGAPPAITSSSSSPYGSSPPSYSSSPSYNQYPPPPPDNQYGSYSPPPAQYTPPPQTHDMPYSSFMAGGYKSMDCGYGYQKGYDGSCTSTQNWVRIRITSPFLHPIDPATSGLRLVATSRRSRRKHHIV